MVDSRLFLARRGAGHARALNVSARRVTIGECSAELIQIEIERSYLVAKTTYIGGDVGETHIDIQRFSTLDVPARDRFEVWTAGGHCAYSLEDSASVPFDWDYTGAAVGAMSVGEHRWLHAARRATIKATRNRPRIRADGLDVCQFTLHASGALVWQSASETGVKRPDELYLVDAGQPFDSRIAAGSMLWLAVPRALLSTRVDSLHGSSLMSGTGRLLADHIRSLIRNLPILTTAEIPDIARSTARLANACVSGTPDAVAEAGREIGMLLRQRVQRHIDAHLLAPDLTPDSICKAVGVSRAKLYQLFEPMGDIMHRVRRRRLELARHVLANPARPAESIASVAWRHGFADEKYFSRAFKAAFGHTPSETLEQAGVRTRSRRFSGRAASS
ncbi:helix-turn-helix domain protein [Burkholderia sp. ABCPW 111]|nr:helix-turn-helix domain protein [Burkholderia sp. ABCPW 111]